MAEQGISVAIVGLGRVGGTFLQKLIERGNGIKIAAAAESDKSAPGVQLAKDNGITVYDDGKEVAAMGEDIDIIFDFTGNSAARAEFRSVLAGSGNQRTVIVPEVVVKFIWGIMVPGEKFPEYHEDNGY